MSSAREAILGRVRAALHRRAPLDHSIAVALDARLDGGQPHIKPEIGPAIIERFIEKVGVAAGEIEQLVGLGNLAQSVLEYVEREALPPEIVVSADPTLAGLRWPNELAVSRDRPALDSDRVSVTTAFAGIAETGTVSLDSDRDHPTTLNFLPEHHLVVLERSRVFPHLEDLWVALRRERPAMPRTVNLVTGPSRTGDVELTMEFGAHGPRRLYVFLIG